MYLLLSTLVLRSRLLENLNQDFINYSLLLCQWHLKQKLHANIYVEVHTSSSSSVLFLTQSQAELQVFFTAFNGNKKGQNHYHL